MKPPKARIRRGDNWITVTVRVNGSEVVGRIYKRYPYKGKWLRPKFEWENVNGHDVDTKAAVRFYAAIGVCMLATQAEWFRLPEADRVKAKL